MPYIRKVTYALSWGIDIQVAASNRFSYGYINLLPGSWELIDLIGSGQAIFNNAGSLTVLEVDSPQKLKPLFQIEPDTGSSPGNNVPIDTGTSDALAYQGSTSGLIQIRMLNFQWQPKNVYYAGRIRLSCRDWVDNTLGVLDATHVVTIDRNVFLTFEARDK